MPPGVINMLPGDGLEVSDVALHAPRPRRHPLHRLDADLPAPVARRSARTSRRTAPTRASSARPAARTSSSRTRPPTPTCCGSAMIRGAFEFQGQKCSAASRAYVAASVWKKLQGRARRRDREPHDGRRHRPVELHGRGHRRPRVRQAQEGDRPGEAVREARRARRRHRSTTRSATSSGRRSWSPPTRPTRCSTTEYFGPILAVHVYDDGDFEKVVDQMESFAPYALTGAVIAQDRAGGRVGAASGCGSPPATSTSTTSRPVRSSGSSRSVVPARRAPTTRPAPRNLMRWTSPRSIKETFAPPKDHRYPHMG